MTDVKGYTPLSDAQKDLANEGKELEERYMRWLDKVADQTKNIPGDEIIGAVDVVRRYDQRALALARTHIQTGAMWAIRSIFQPSRISLPEDEA